MTESEGEPEDIILRATQKAAIRFAAVRAGQLASRIIWRLRRIEATGIFSDDFTCRTLWDEYCVEVQEGPFDGPVPFGLPSVSAGFGMTIDPFIRSEIDALPKHEAVLLTLRAIEDWDERQQARTAGSIFEDAMMEMLRGALRREASNVDLSKFRDRSAGSAAMI